MTRGAGAIDDVAARAGADYTDGIGNDLAFSRAKRWWRAAGEPDLKGKALAGLHGGAKNLKNHLDVYDFKRFFEGKVSEGRRRGFFSVSAIR